MVTSFTTYSLSHNIGASLLSGTIVRFRAYGSRGLSRRRDRRPGRCHLVHLPGRRADARRRRPGHPAGGRPALLRRAGLGGVVIGLALLCRASRSTSSARCSTSSRSPSAGSTSTTRSPNVVIRQLIIGPLELLAAAAIIYFCLPAEGNPGFITVLGMFVASFSMAIVSHAPGGLGVLEYVFLTGLDDMDQARGAGGADRLPPALPAAPVRRGAGHRARLRALGVPAVGAGAAGGAGVSAEAPERRDAPGT